MSGAGLSDLFAGIERQIPGVAGLLLDSTVVIDADPLTPHARQAEFLDSTAKRKIIRAGRRGGKTVGIAIGAVRSFQAGHRVLYGAPTSEQVDAFWYQCKKSLARAINSGQLRKNESEHLIELPGTERRLRAKTCWNADTLRGDYADMLILDEFQLMAESTWKEVGAPMLLDNDGNAVFIYTPPSLHARAKGAVSKASDPQHAAKMFRKAQLDTSRRWATFHFSSRENPHISAAALDEISSDMTALSYRMEILAEDVTEAPGALWTRAMLEAGRGWEGEDFDRIVVAIDPSGSTTGDEAGIITAGKRGKDFVILADDSLQGSPETWARKAVAAYHYSEADCIVAEKNYGGEMVELTIRTVDPLVKVKLVTATRGKQVRAEPISAIFEHNHGHLAGSFPKLEDELCLWIPGASYSPGRLDACVWAGTELMLHPSRAAGDCGVS